MRHQEEAPVAEAAAADRGAAAGAADDDDEDGGGGGVGDVDAHSFPPDTENHCMSQVVPVLHTPHSPPLTSRG